MSSLRYDKFQGSFTGEAQKISCKGWGVFGLDVAGSFTGSFVLKGSNNNTTWTTLKAFTGELALSAAGHYTYDVAGYAMLAFEDAGDFDGTALLCGLLTATSSTLAVAAAQATAGRSFRTFGSLVAPSDNYLPIQPGYPGGLTAARYRIENDGAEDPIFKWLYACLGNTSIPPKELYLRYDIGDNADTTVYPTLADAEAQTNAIATQRDGNVDDASVILTTDGYSPWGWLYGKANYDGDNRILKCTRVQAEIPTIDLSTGGNWSGRRLVAETVLLVSNSGSDTSCTLSFLCGNTFFNTGEGTAAIPSGASDAVLKVRQGVMLAENGNDTKVAFATQSCEAWLDGVPIECASGNDAIEVQTKNLFQGYPLSMYMDGSSLTDIKLVSCHITLEPEEVAA